MFELSLVQEYFKSLPEYGVGVHGTTSKNASEILQSGLKKVSSHPRQGNHFYHFNPNLHLDDVRGIINSMRLGLLNVWEYAIDRTNDQGGANNKPSIVVFLPHRIPPYVDHRYDDAYVQAVAENEYIAPDRIVGMIELPKVTISRKDLLEDSSLVGNSFYSRIRFTNTGSFGRKDLDTVLLQIKKMLS